MTNYVWRNCDASEDDVKDSRSLIYERINYVPYAQGNILRNASLSDVKYADCWDVETVTGVGSLYITGKPYANEDIEIETSIFHEDCTYSDDTSIIKDRNQSVNDSSSQLLLALSPPNWILDVADKNKPHSLA
uniref:Uncharacterized protein n=1 Tax=Amphimedon queenslandica TaxID=400682 RepID=A0A1X7VWS8_AMPQE